MIRAALLVGCLVVGAVPAAAKQPRKIVETQNQYHLTVMGDGYIYASDSNKTPYLIRSVSLRQDDNGWLGVVVGDKWVLLEPRIKMPSDATNLFVSPTGDVSVLTRKSDTLLKIGQLKLASPHNPFGIEEALPSIFTLSPSNVPILDVFGEELSTFVFQGWIEKRILAIEAKP